MGYFASQDEYESISFFYQARIGGTGGVGHIHRETFNQRVDIILP